MKLTLTHLRHTCIATLTCLVILTVIWWGLWTMAAHQYRHVIEGWVEAGRGEGYVITYNESQLFGFPRHIVMRFTNVSWRNTDNILFHADDIDIGATPWQWQSFSAKFKNHVEIDAPIDDAGTTLVLGGEDGRAHVDLDPQGYWRFSKIALTHARLGQAPRFIVTADNLEASAERPLHMPQDHHEAGLTLEGKAENVNLPDTIPSPFGPQIARLDVHMRVMGVVPDFRKKESVDAWNKDSGVVEFDNLNMNWGPLKMTAQGTMGFDDDLQPEGAFVSKLGDHDKVLKALMDHGYIAQRQQEMMTEALAVFSKQSKADDVKGIELPIAVQLGGMFLGPVKIFTFPEIQWPTAAAVTPITP